MTKNVIWESFPILRELPKPLIILISNYDPKAILLYEDYQTLNWHWLMKNNFDLEYESTVPSSEMINVYFEKCFRNQALFPGSTQTFIRHDNGYLIRLGSSPSDISKPEITPVQDEEINQKISEMSCGYNHFIIKLTDGRIMGVWTIGIGSLGQK